MKLPFVTRARFEAMEESREYWNRRFREVLSQHFESRGEITTLNAEIADRIRSETDAREQLRALKASAVMRDPKTGRLLPKVAGQSA